MAALNPGARLFLVLASLLLLGSCSTFKGWFTPQGQKLNQAQDLAAAGHPLGASALAVEALVLEPGYPEATRLLAQSFGPGQEEFRSSVARWTASSVPEKWDRLFELLSWQETLAREGAGIDSAYAVEPVTAERARVGREAAGAHWSTAQNLLARSPGPRQARLALAEGRVAAGFDRELPGLRDWLTATEAAATQKVLIVPFFYEGGSSLGALSGPLGSSISRQLLEEGGLPELTTVFSSDRLVTLPGGGLARLGLISQPDALELARQAGQNVVLLGQVTRALYQPPRKSETVVLRERTVSLVDPEHPQGIEKLYRAAVTTALWSSQLTLTASYSLVEVATGHDLLNAVREVKVTDQTTIVSFVGDREALNSDDLRGLGDRSALQTSDALWARAIDGLADEVAQSVRDALKP